MTKISGVYVLMIRPNTVVALHEFTKPAPSLSPQPLGHVIDHDKNVFFDTLVFDAEHDYAQVQV